MLELFKNVGIGDVFGLIAIVGFGWVYLRGSADKATIASQEKLIESRGNEITDLERRVTTVEGENKSLKGENAALTKAVAHVEELVELKQTLEQMRDAFDSHQSEQTAILGRILVALEAA